MTTPVVVPVSERVESPSLAHLRRVVEELEANAALLRPAPRPQLALIRGGLDQEGGG
jgi:hypothetical protein